MKLGSLRSRESRDGVLCVVSRDLKRAVRATGVAPSLREAIESWSVAEPRLREIAQRLENGSVAGEFAVDQKEFHSPLPRAFQWADGSAFLHHVKLVRMARKAEMPPSFYHDPLMYQGGSDDFLAPTDPIPQVDFAHGTDFEGEVAVVTTDVPIGISPEAALKHIALVMVVNDVSLRGLIPEELAKGFGFFQSKPQSAFAPFAVTPDELGSAWRDGRVHLPLNVTFNGGFFGNADAGAMHFHFGQLIAHVARTRTLGAGSIIGSGTVSNEDPSRGSSCLAERRMIEQIGSGEAKTPFMKVGDRVQMEMLNEQGQSLFGAIDQVVEKAKV
ncbi:MAG: fumarylacetoacetate hydrolase family protein [Bdellovibrionales bacterium]|nr:fumarylacetoacetate hydrolase family protein [Bdellovibrionales bacterium]